MSIQWMAQSIRCALRSQVTTARFGNIQPDGDAWHADCCELFAPAPGVPRINGESTMNHTTQRLSVLLAGACLATLLVQPALAAQDPSSPTPASQRASSAQGQQSPSEWVRQALQSNKEEIAISKEATKRSSNAEVRQYAEMLVRDHSQTVERLGELGKRHGIAAPPTAAGTEDSEARTRLSIASDVDFDRAFLDVMVQAHESAIVNYTGATRLNDAEVANYARETLPTLHKHHEQARLLRQSLPPSNDIARGREHRPDRDYD